jgi:hypothetical protein
MRLLSFCLALCVAILLTSTVQSCPPDPAPSPSLSLSAGTGCYGAQPLLLQQSYAPVSVLRLNTGSYYGAAGGLTLIDHRRGFGIRLGVRRNVVAIGGGGPRIRIDERRGLLGNVRRRTIQVR